MSKKGRLTIKSNASLRYSLVNVEDTKPVKRDFFYNFKELFNYKPAS
jgi:hypothetical protein